MTIKPITLTWAIIAIASLLLTACNPIPAEPVMPSSVPTPFVAPEREPMQASLYDFASVFADFEDDGIEPELYAEAILKIRDCMEGEPLERVDDPYTPGQKAAIHWITILTVIAYYAFEDVDPDAPELYDHLIEFHESCMNE